ncbi:hypothetical protein A3D84_01320 [Candidatus Woesebacteria bacterium RIFCSPHIGHO2_02_FULL_42_20]|uniref:DUF192 domain-containing protein n=1 Tax=Candidatus Woesebacteria bacterium RIFCSPHIGHO2_12_FULL_41_24 TaxID=1802510 RepID=A0A1F8ASI4_9BACT|nr:MAG: hypothetical protein A2W15_05535 [Candidatus Woesebacteria bacterium RBG_16_41_13]OGM30910.1 MAG: hypothetical protein A2873_03850 [Candidatus Woesebacteria bacterium RIFCSPHIGHO2_01_FULL_42_80]OGM35879.1 MAG: hypothetical protein A3D84_01320 [Candidatus Woesebacteria bacterium RIFCSPHIGHO2_02_FULL_42_20]OGM54228.1 MAG: hypothetical protein A3E44_00935 [Candidatus Woesebacteria bacterium RIFCSPHIGHO2_12_FULL_41_24]OGM66129.1 MAG: hypothetical protein A2969_04175 [Candidatus Woesebacteri
MNRKYLVVTISLAAIILLLILRIKTPSNKQSLLTINSVEFNLLIANTDESRQNGLAIYDALPLDTGMLFDFKEQDVNATFWMKNMKFPIDIIWIDNNKIVSINKNAPQPQSETPNEALTLYSSGKPVDYVFEINSGLSDMYGFKIGDDVTFVR